ncbi:MAG: sigma-70 family RNA polymerase sigma factor [Planctomyces sp.]|nr:sigma-70 family RNA polymerase sigma factor [Planctomyces sp.]
MTMTLPETRHSLFVRLSDAADHQAWQEFATIYEPAVYRFARRSGLQHADAAELTQDVLARLSQSLPDWYDGPGRGPFRRWLFAIARSRLIDGWRRSQRRLAALGAPLGGDAIESLAVRDDGEPFEVELRREMIRASARALRSEFQETTWLAFWKTTIEGLSPQAAAEALGMTPGAVYGARSRVLARLRTQVRHTWSAWTASGEERP